MTGDGKGVGGEEGEALREDGRQEDERVSYEEVEGKCDEDEGE